MLSVTVLEIIVDKKKQWEYMFRVTEHGLR
jgi:hypothetical protein